MTSSNPIIIVRQGEELGRGRGRFDRIVPELQDVFCIQRYPCAASNTKLRG